MLEEFKRENLGNIWEEDTLSEVLYKMNEHLNHILLPLGEFQVNEEMMQSSLKEHEHLPFIMRSFQDMPENLEQEIKFVENIDYQLLKIKEQYEEMVYKAIDLTNQNKSMNLALDLRMNDLMNELAAAMRLTTYRLERFAKQDGALDAILQIEALGSKLAQQEKTYSEGEGRGSDLLELKEGIEWSTIVFDEIEWRLDDAR